MKMDWQDIQDSAGEIFDIEQAREDIRKERLAQEESEEFLDICNDLLMEGLVDEDAIEEEAHKLMSNE
jgi:hypothetical protein